jgi:hypothetical protein
MSDRIVWDEARILETDSNSGYNKFKEPVHATCLINLISQSSFDTSSMWSPPQQSD